MEDAVIELVPEAEKPVLARYLQFYLYEHAEFEDRKAVDGVFRYRWFDAYWREPDRRWPFWMRTAEDVVAFALVRLDDEDGRYEMAEFFVVNRYRGQGLGDRFARDVLLRFDGEWKVSQVLHNKRAVAFWRRVIGGLGDYREAKWTSEKGVAYVGQRFVIGDRQI